MGFFGKLVNAGRKAIGFTGGVLKKVGDVAAPIAQKIGQFSKPIGEAAGAITTAMGMPEVGALVNKGLNFFGSGKAAELAAKASQIGAKMQDVADSGRG